MRVALVVAVTGLVAGWMAPVPARAEEPGVEIEKADEVLVVGADGARVLVLNTTAAAVPVTASVTARAEDGQTARLAVTPLSTSVPAADELELRVTRISFTDLNKSAAGYLVVVAGAGDQRTVMRRPVRVIVPSGTPGTTTWHTAWAPWPWTRAGVLDGVLPVTQGGCLGVDMVQPDRPVLASGHHTGRLALGCRKRAVVLKAEDFPEWGYGDYAGTVMVGDTPVNITVRRTAPIWIAIFLLAVGLVLALRMQGWLDNRRGVRLMLSQLNLLEKRSSSKVGLAVPMKKSVTKARQRLRTLVYRGPRGWLPWPDGFHVKEFEELDTEIKKLTALVDAWPQFLIDRAEVAQHMPFQDEDRVWAPDLYTSLEQLTAEFADSTEGLTKQTAETAAAKDALAVVTTAKETNTRIAAAEQAIDGQVLLLAAEARQRHNVLRSQLKRAKSSIETKAIADTVNRVLLLVDQLPHPESTPLTLESPADTQSEVVTSQQTTSVERLRRLSPNVVLAVKASAGRLWRGVQSIMRVARGADIVIRDAVIALLVAAVGIWSGLALLYNDKAWGSVNDMIAALVWGFATPTLVAPVLTAVRRIGSRESAVRTPMTAGSE